MMFDSAVWAEANSGRAAIPAVRSIFVDRFMVNEMQGVGLMFIGI